MKIGVALGSGSARGWAHIGVLGALHDAGIHADIVCGTSIGALVGAACADDRLAALEAWVSELTWRKVASYFDISLRGGLLKGEKIIGFMHQNFLTKDISALLRPFAAVATDLESGREIWLREGLVSAAVRASMAMPGLFTPCERDGRLLVDGSLVNPVPISLCRAMGAEFVIAVDLSADLVGGYARSAGRRAGLLPSITEVVINSIDIMQARIALYESSEKPADAVIMPKVSHLGLLEYHRAREAIAQGRDAAAAMTSHLRSLLLDFPRKARDAVG
jgi:NTE family protein